MQRPPRSGTRKSHISIKKHPTLALRNVIDGVEFRLGIGFSQWDIEAGKSRWSKCAGTTSINEWGPFFGISQTVVKYKRHGAPKTCKRVHYCTD